MDDISITARLMRDKRKRRLLHWKRPILLIACCIIGIGGYLLYKGGSSLEPTFITQPVKRGDLVVSVTASGSVQPIEQVEISSELSGTVRAVNVDFNSSVKAGDVVAVLDTNKLEADVKNSEAKLRSAEASVAKASADLDAYSDEAGH